MAVPTQAQLMRHLRRGRAHPRTAGEIADHFDCSDGGVQVAVRDVIRNAIAAGQLIGSHSRGFYIIDDVADYNRYLASLESRRDQIADRIANLRASGRAIGWP